MVTSYSYHGYQLWLLAPLTYHPVLVAGYLRYQSCQGDALLKSDESIDISITHALVKEIDVLHYQTKEWDNTAV